MKTTNIKSSTSLNNNRLMEKIANIARNVGITVYNGRKHQANYTYYDNKLQKMRKIMSPSPVFLYSFIFLIACAVEIICSWIMYREFIAGMYDSQNPMAIILIGFFIVGLAAIVSHCFGLFLSSDLYRLKIEKYLSNNEDMLLNDAEEIALRTKKRNVIIGLFLFIITITMVAKISWLRANLMEEVTGIEYPLIQKLFPIGAVLVEILTGIFLGYLITLLQYLYLRWKERIRYERCLVTAKIADSNIAELTKRAQYNDGIYSNMEIICALYRFYFRKAENYLDVIDNTDIEEMKNSVIRINREYEKRY